MPQLEQRINFYQDLFRKPEIRFPFQQMLLVWGGMLAVLLVVTLLDYVRTQALRGQAERVQVNHDRMAAAVNQLTEQVAKLVLDPVLEKQAASLRETLDGKRRFLAALKIQGDTHQNHFSSVLDGLANLDARAIWLTRIQIRSPGPELSLTGMTTDARAVPDYLAMLRNEAVFDGVQFRMLNVERTEERGRYLSFSVSTQHEDKLAR